VDGTRLFQFETDRCRALRAHAHRTMPQAPVRRFPMSARARLAAALVAILLLASGIALAITG
jgi:hypothetical protein